MLHANRQTRFHLDSIQTQFTQNQSTSVCPCGKPGAGRAYLLNLGGCNKAMLGQCGAPLKSVIVMFHTLKCHIVKPQKGISTLVLEKCYLYYFHRNFHRNISLTQVFTARFDGALTRGPLEPHHRDEKVATVTTAVINCVKPNMLLFGSLFDSTVSTTARKCSTARG